MNANLFIAGRGPLYKIDPRAKVLTTLITCIFVFLPIYFSFLVIFSLSIIVLSFYSIGVEDTKRIFNSVLPMLIIMLIFSPFYERDGKALLMIKNTLILTKEGLLQSLLLNFRFLTITYVCSLLFTTTKMDEFMLSLQYYRLPYKASLTISLVFRSIPSIFDAFNQISDSHKLRRADEKIIKNNLKNKLKNLFPTLTSALVVSLRSIPTLAMSLEAKGYGLANKRTSYHDLSKHKHPILESIAYVIVFVILFLIFRIK